MNVFSTATTPMRRAVLAACCAAALTLQPALADDKNLPPAPNKAMHEQCPHMQGDATAHMQMKLDDLGEKLHLKDSQQAAWKTYRGQLTDMSTMHEKMKPADGHARGEKMHDMPAPERLQKTADRMRLGAESLDKLAKQTATFYKVLSPEQQTIFDLYQRKMHPHKGMGGGMSSGMSGGMHHGM